MRRVFDSLPQILGRIRCAGSIALFLDFDGTISRIRTTPDEARLSHPMRTVLTRLAANSRVRVWVVSGRKLDDVRNRTKINGVQHLGLHGWEGRLETSLHPETQGALDRAKGSLAELLGKLRGIRIEDKGHSLAVHYREAAETESSMARASMNEVMARLNGGFRLLSGKKVWEILPREVGDKGSAVRRELSRLEHRPLPVYIGDDITDESAFAALPEGLTIRVGPNSLTHAQFQLYSPAEVRRFLQELEIELS